MGEVGFELERLANSYEFVPRPVLPAAREEMPWQLSHMPNIHIFGEEPATFAGYCAAIRMAPAAAAGLLKQTS